MRLSTASSASKQCATKHQSLSQAGGNLCPGGLCNSIELKIIDFIQEYRHVQQQTTKEPLGHPP
jgi:hypothetical protein